MPPITSYAAHDEVCLSMLSLLSFDDLRVKLLVCAETKSSAAKSLEVTASHSSQRLYATASVIACSL